MTGVNQIDIVRQNHYRHATDSPLPQRVMRDPMEMTAQPNNGLMKDTFKDHYSL